MIRELWDHRIKQADMRRESAKTEIAGVEHKSANLVDRIVDCENERLIKSYEKRIADLEEEKSAAEERCTRQKPGHTGRNCSNRHQLHLKPLETLGFQPSFTS